MPISLLALAAGYFIGALPVGFLIVRLLTGKDIRREHSGRSGGTNVLRTAGFWPGLATVVGDILKGASSVWLAHALTGGNEWIKVGAGLLAIVGHNYSVFLMDREDGRLRLRGGAGGAPSVGVAMGFWWPIALIIIPVGGLILYFLGYASVATMSIPVITFVVFTIRALLGVGPWVDVWYPVGAEVLLLWALRPNIVRLLNGTERIVGYRAKRGKRASGERASDGGV